QPGRRSQNWVKLKTARDQACVVVGFTPPAGGRKHVGALALAVLEGETLAYSGLVGSGFDDATLSKAMGALAPRVEAGPPAGMKRATVAPKEVTWVHPELICEVKFTEWTRDNLLRQAPFLGMRPDLTPADCARQPG